MMRLLGGVVLCIALQGNAVAYGLQSDMEQKGNTMLLPKEAKSGLAQDRRHGDCRPGPTGPRGPTGSPGNPGPDFGQYACLYSNVAQPLTTGQNVLFGNQISLSGIVYNSTDGVFTLPPGTYSVTYFSTPLGSLSSASELNLVANGAIVPNSPFGGCATILTLSNDTNTLALQAQASITLTLPSTIPQCNAMITIYQID